MHCRVQAGVVRCVTGIQALGAWPSLDSVTALSNAAGTKDADVWAHAITRFQEKCTAASRPAWCRVQAGVNALLE